MQHSEPLRDVLAQRIYAVSEAYWGPQRQTTRWNALSPHSQGQYLAIADETLRQILWNQADVAHMYRSGEGFESRNDALTDAKNHGITLAPPDWSPE